MAYPRHVMQSVEIPAVTQVRASCDYHPGNTAGCSYPYCQWNIGTSSLLAHAVGIAPSKDGFWSTEIQPGNKYDGKVVNSTTEPFSALGGAITAYSTGPVAIGDGIGFSNPALVLRACTATSGTLLQPSRPATTIDACFYQAAFGGSAGPVAAKPRNYPVWSTHTLVSGIKFAHVLAIELDQSFPITPGMLPVDVDAAAHVLYMQWTGFGAASNITAAEFSAKAPIKLTSCGGLDFQVHHIVPVFPNGVALLGEPHKWVPISVARFRAVVFGKLKTPARGCMLQACPL